MNFMKLKIVPELDPDFIPAQKWNTVFRSMALTCKEKCSFELGIERSSGVISTFKSPVLPHEGEKFQKLNIKYIERILKFLLWSKGGSRVLLVGDANLCNDIKNIYSNTGDRSFDVNFCTKAFGSPLKIDIVEKMPEVKEKAVTLGRNLDGCRIGFDLGGSDRKCAAMIDGKVVYSEEIKWDPYFEKSPEYHLDGIRDTLRRAAEKLPHVDAIGGSAAGIYVDNEVRISSLFRGVSEEDFESKIRNFFFDLQKEWDGIPFEVVNDGEVTALAGAMSLNDNDVLGISMGTSLAAGYVNSEGNITEGLNELAFAPVDYRDDGPIDEWSGDRGCGVQYFSQQGIARLIAKANLPEIDPTLPFAEQLILLQYLMEKKNEQARKVYETVGVCFGYSIAHYAEFYSIKNLLILGRVTSGEAGAIIIQKAEEVLKAEYPKLAEQIKIVTPNEKDKRHGQAVAAASLAQIVSSDKMAQV
jgi:predicted NBD/HSP70 family sugar kinase